MAGLAARLRKEGLEPVPHLVARRLGSLPAVEDYLKRLTEDAGVVQALIVAGDAPTSGGGLHSSLEILDSGLLEKYNLRTIGVAGHPEGHPDVTDEVLREALRRKNAYAKKTGASMYIVTQFTFSADALFAWEKSYAGDIGRLPVRVGMPGLASVGTLLKYAIECGVGPSLQAFSKRYASLTKLLTVSAPDGIIVNLARYRARTPDTRFSGVHFFTFGGFRKTAEWANKIVDGKFEVTEDGGLVLI